MKILIADDNRDNLYLLESILKGSGYEVASAANGAEALEKLRAGRFGMIISDILMPVMDGFQLCRECKGDDGLRDIPFVFYTATYTEEKDEELALKWGANKFIRKPMEPDEFVKIIEGVFADTGKGKAESVEPSLKEEEETFKLYSERLVKKLEKKMLGLESENAERRQAEARLEHLNGVLLSIRTVNQLIAVERERDTLLQKACNVITATRDYNATWLGLLNDDGTFATVTDVGFGEHIRRFSQHLMSGGCVPCIESVLAGQSPLTVVDKEGVCGDCLFKDICISKEAVIIRIEHAGRLFGLLAILLAPEVAIDDEEKDLLMEVTGDLGIALHNMELDEKQKLAEEALRESQTELFTIYDNAPVLMLLLDSERRVRKANRAATEFTGHPIEEMMGLRGGEALCCLHSLDDPKGCGAGPFCETCIVRNTVQDTLATGNSHFGVEASLPFTLGGKQAELSFLVSTSPLSVAESPMALVCIMDITEHKRAEKKLAESEQKFRGLVENLRDVVFRISVPDAKYEYISSNVERLSGYSVAGFMNTPLFIGKLLHPDSVESFMKAWAEISEGKMHPTLEYKIIDADGNERWILQSSKGVYNSEGAIIALEGICMDITGRKQAEEALAESARYTRALIEASIDPMVTVSKEGYITDVNQAAVDITGWPRDEIVGTHCYDYFVEPEKARQAYEQVFREGSIRDYPLEIQHRDGRIISVLYSAALYYDASGNVAGVFATVHDITSRKRVEEALRKRTRDLGKRVKELACLYNLTQLINEPGISLEEILRRAVDIISPGWQYPEITGARIVLENEEYKTKNYQDTIWMQTSDITIGGSKVGVLEVCYLEERPPADEGPFLREERDLIDTLSKRLSTTIDRMQAREELDIANQYLQSLNIELEEKVKERTKELEETTSAAETANRAKSDFLSSMSHELRTPMTSIIGFSELLAGRYFGELNEKQADYIDDILDSSRHLLSLINDVLDLSKIEAGKMELELSPVNVDTLLRNSLTMLREKALKHRLDLKLDVPASLRDIEIKADERKLKQVMFNLLSNATKFTPDGGDIEITAVKEGKNLVVTVADTGIGIKPGDLEKIFAEFYQVSSGTVSKTPGTGLGLSLSRQFVELHDGKIRAESEGEGRGSRFIFTLPLRGRPARKRKAQGNLVLVVDDNEGVRGFLTEVIKADGYGVVAVADGETALEALREREFSLVFLDLKLPGISGVDVLKEMKDRAIKAEVAIISGYLDPSVTEEAMKFGPLTLISQPFTDSDIQTVLSRALNR